MLLWMWYTYNVYVCTGDPHASERIGPSCSRTQLAVSMSQLVAAARGALSADICLIQVGEQELFDTLFQ